MATLALQDRALGCARSQRSASSTPSSPSVTIPVAVSCEHQLKHPAWIRACSVRSLGGREKQRRAPDPGHRLADPSRCWIKATEPDGLSLPASFLRQGKGPILCLGHRRMEGSRTLSAQGIKAWAFFAMVRRSPGFSGAGQAIGQPSALSLS